VTPPELEYRLRPAEQVLWWGRPASVARAGRNDLALLPILAIVTATSASALFVPRGWHPVVAIEDWERSDLMRKHPASASARLDWRPRAEFGDETRVFLYDPLDRTAPPRWQVDRVH